MTVWRGADAFLYYFIPFCFSLESVKVKIYLDHDFTTYYIKYSEEDSKSLVIILFLSV